MGWQFDITTPRAARRAVFTNPNTEAPWTHWALRETWMRAAESAGFPKKRIHLAGNTRHSRATAELQRGSDPRLVQALLGHASFSTTKRHYAEIGAAALRRVVMPDSEGR